MDSLQTFFLRLVGILFLYYLVLVKAKKESTRYWLLAAYLTFLWLNLWWYNYTTP